MFKIYIYPCQETEKKNSEGYYNLQLLQNVKKREKKTSFIS